jgi:hypothetical protein
MVSHASVAALRAAGNDLYTAGDVKAALKTFTTAVADARSLWTRGQTGESGRELTLALNNRAACYLSLGEPQRVLSDTWEVLTLLLAPHSREWQRTLRSGAGWSCDWVLAAYCKSTLRRAAALELLSGDALAALPSLAWLASRTGAPEEVVAAARASGCALQHAGSACQPASWAPLALARRDAPPLPRRHPGCAALGGCVYLFGGDASTEAGDAPCDDLWRLRLPPPGPAMQARWERLTASSGPPATRRATALASTSGDELLVLTDALAVHAYAPSSNAWRAVGSLHAAGAPASAADVAWPMLTVTAGHLLALAHTGGEWWLTRLQLDGRRAAERAWLPAGPARRTGGVIWLEGASRLRMFGGCEDAPCGVPGHNTHAADGAPLNELWELPLGGLWAPPGAGGSVNTLLGDGLGVLAPPARAWARVPYDGGGTPPPARVGAAAVALGGGRVLLYGGYSEQLPAHPPVVMGGRPVARYCNDAHIFDPGQGGWRRVHTGGMGGPPALAPHPAAHVCLARDDASRRLFVCGGLAAHPPTDAAHGVLPLHCGLFELRCSAERAEAAAEAEAAARGAELNWLRLRHSAQPPAAGPRNECGPTEREFAAAFANGAPHIRDALVAAPAPSPAAFDALWAAATALRGARARPPGEDVPVCWEVSWSCVWTNAQLPHGNIYLLTVRGDDWRQAAARAHDDAAALPVRASLLVGPGEPTAGDVAFAILQACTLPAPSSCGSACLPDAVRFAARTAHLLDALFQLLRSLDVAAAAEPWAEAALSALRCGASPYGWDQLNEDAALRCHACRAVQDAEDLRGTRVKACADCRVVRYCCADCASADWEAHRVLCTVLCANEGKAGALLTALKRRPAAAFAVVRGENGDLGIKDVSFRGVWI